MNALTGVGPLTMRISALSELESRPVQCSYNASATCRGDTGEQLEQERKSVLLRNKTSDVKGDCELIALLLRGQVLV